MIQPLYDKMAIPDTCHLGKRVYKKLFHENARLGVTDRNALRDDVDTIFWEYTLKPSTIPIHPYQDDQREYGEIAVIQVNLKTDKRTGRIAEIIHRAIPYPLVVIFSLETACTISLAQKRFSQSEKDAIVAEHFQSTDWIDLCDPSPTDAALLDSLAVGSLPQTHFYAFYQAMVDRLTAWECSRLTGKYTVESQPERRQQRRELLAGCHELKLQIADARAKAKRENQISRLTELNLEIKRLERQLNELVQRL